MDPDDRELLESFVDEARGYLDTIQAVARRRIAGEAQVDDDDRLRAALHTLKGVSGMMGFEALHHLAADLEGRLPEAGAETAAAAVAALETALAEVATGDGAGGAAAHAAFTRRFGPGAGDGEVPAAGPAVDAALADALADEAAEAAAAVDQALAEAAADRRPAPRQRAAATVRPGVLALVGAAAQAGRDDVAGVGRALADLLGALASGRYPADDAAIDLARRGAVHLAALPAGPGGAATSAFVTEVEAILGDLEAAEVKASLAPEEDTELRAIFAEEARDHLAEIDGALSALAASGRDGDAVRRLLRATHTLKGASGTVGLRTIMDAAHGLEDLFTGVRDAGRPVDPALLQAARDGLRTLWTLVQGDGEERPPGPAGAAATGGRSVRVATARLDALMLGAGDLLAARGRSAEVRTRFTEALRLVERRRGELAARLEGFALDKPLVALVSDGDLALDGGDDVDRLARDLADLDFHLGEAVGSLARLATSLATEVDEVAEVASRIQDGLLRARFVPLESLFRRFVRPAADWAREEGKEVEVVVEASAAEVDRSVVEAVADPLVHLVRNAVTHGLEPPAERIAEGKAGTGRLALRAREEGHDVVVEVEDDGRGLDPEGLRRAAVARGILTEAQAAATPDAQIVEVIFAPGFSTREAADAMAGRGVGLDVVATAVARLGGVLSVSRGELGGTLFSARLPTTMAILPILTVAGAGQVMALPLAAVRETVVVDGAAFEARRLSWRGESLRVARLEDLFGPGPVRDATSRRRLMVIVGHGGRNAALAVDRILAREEGVVRSLGPILAPLPLYAGAVVGGDGRVRLVLDVSYLLSVAMGARPVAPAETPEPGPRAGPRILVVDDSISVRTHLGRLLRSAGYEVEVAADGQAALDRLQVDSFDLVLTDLEMPRLHGLELLSRMQADERLAQIPTVVLSSRAGPRHRERARALGARDFLAKPVSREELVKRLGAILDGAPAVGGPGGPSG